MEVCLWNGTGLVGHVEVKRPTRAAASTTAAAWSAVAWVNT
jgi:hypothetical protein